MECKLMYSPSMIELKAELVRGLDAFYSGSKLNRVRGLWKAYRAMQQLPEPTKENTDLSNTHLLVGLRDVFFKWEDNPGRDGVFRTLWKFTIWIYELDAYYRDRIDFLLEKWQNIAHIWVPRAHNKPRMTYWREFDEARTQRMDEKRVLLEARHGNRSS